MDLAQFVQDYGYPVLLIGTFLEGETILILGGLAAHLGYLSLVWVIVCGFCGTLVGDQLWFYLGRRHGKTLLARRPAWQPRAQRVFRKLERHQNLLILSFRYLYGLRTITPFAIGMSDVSYIRFAVLNLIGAALWAIGIGLGGYFFGKAVETLLGNVKRYEMVLMFSIFVAGTGVWLVHIYRQRRAPVGTPNDRPPANERT